MLKARINNLVNQSVKELAQIQVMVNYHDGQVNCRMVENRNNGKTYYVTGQIARCIKSGRFVSFKEIYC